MNARRPKVMLVEDEEAVRLLLRLTLELGSVEIVEAPDGDTAVERFLAERPDVVFLDWTLPGRSGIEVCREIRAQLDTENTTIIMLTARSGEEERRVGLAAGADDYISKPFSPEHLLDKLREVLGPKALLGEA
jgi:two-component system, OmpR family, phosphate regulon response regulator PhoB